MLALPALALTPIPVPGFTSTPTDPDFDGLYEDLNANDRIDYNDVVVFFKNMTWIADNEPVACFDFNGNRRIDYNDIVRLFKEVGVPLPWDGMDRYDPAANGSTVQIPLGEGGLVITLPENPSTGYHWEATVTSGLTIVDDRFIPNAQTLGVPGAGGTRVWTLSGTSEGVQRFSAIYKQPWMNVTGTEQTFELHILVGENTSPCISLPTGTSLLSESMQGSRNLTIDNQNEDDAVVSLRIEADPYASGNKVVSFYVRGHDQYTCSTIQTGNYTFWYKHGECWDAANATFRVVNGAWRMDDILPYDEDTLGWTIWTSPVEEGNFTAIPVSPDLV
ncbi:MAG: Chagasin family peptidase inhibitor I42 [Euryarchaeota archaeon ADurb.BinA087]|nr:MAG: Chagasin family peptidase inhibitor I42 [Euryarchaeota archaeon ADurb.BinA087]HPX72363.1 protease inhibitor I42 family protein [Methanoregulaceae archaeon]HQA79534.1 protease inhibitor I42 family protein [Methanoregulaceae archaeon]